jgi:hypothetical protein
MSKMLTACPACGGPLRIKLLQCQSCGMELKSDFDRSEFDSLSDEQRAFLLEFLKCRGNLSLLQEGMGISYPTAKKRLGEVLLSLGLISDIEIYDEETADNMDGWKIDAGKHGTLGNSKSKTENSRRPRRRTLHKRQQLRNTRRGGRRKYSLPRPSACVYLPGFQCYRRPSSASGRQSPQGAAPGSPRGRARLRRHHRCWCHRNTLFRQGPQNSRLHKAGGSFAIICAHGKDICRSTPLVFKRHHGESEVDSGTRATARVAPTFIAVSAAIIFGASRTPPPTLPIKTIAAPVGAIHESPAFFCPCLPC